MTKGAPLVIGYPYEIAELKKLFPEPCMVVQTNESMGGFPATAILVTTHVNINSEWFRECAMHRLLPGAKVIRIGSP